MLELLRILLLMIVRLWVPTSTDLTSHNLYVTQLKLVERRFEVTSCSDSPLPLFLHRL